MDLDYDIDFELINGIIDKKMLELPKILLQEKKISSKAEFLEELGITRQNISSIRNGGNRHFSKMHIYRACKKYKINANWLIGMEKNVFRK